MIISILRMSSPDAIANGSVIEMPPMDPSMRDWWRKTFIAKL